MRKETAGVTQQLENTNNQQVIHHHLLLGQGETIPDAATVADNDNNEEEMNLVESKQEPIIPLSQMIIEKAITNKPLLNTPYAGMQDYQHRQ